MKKPISLFKKSARREKSKKSESRVLHFPTSTRELEPDLEVGIKLVLSGKGTLPRKVEGYLRRNLNSLDRPALQMMFEFFEGLCCVFEHRIKIGPPEHLEVACEQIVRDFDEDFLQQFRNIWDAFSETSL